MADFTLDGRGCSDMKHEQLSQRTRVWWDEGEVAFIRWTEKSLVFSWGGAMDTAIHMPRGAVVRLLEKGVLHVEGEMPEWVAKEFKSDKLEIAPLATPAHVPAPVDSPATYPDAKEQPPESRPGLFSAITRLIRKLGGGEDHDPAEVTS
jgi:hypothetical protein